MSQSWALQAVQCALPQGLHVKQTLLQAQAAAVQAVPLFSSGSFMSTGTLFANSRPINTSLKVSPLSKKCDSMSCKSVTRSGSCSIPHSGIVANVRVSECDCSQDVNLPRPWGLRPRDLFVAKRPQPESEGGAYTPWASPPQSLVQCLGPSASPTFKAESPASPASPAFWQ